MYEGGEEPPSELWLLFVRMCLYSQTPKLQLRTLHHNIMHARKYTYIGICLICLTSKLTYSVFSVH